MAQIRLYFICKSNKKSNHFLDKLTDKHKKCEIKFENENLINRCFMPNIN